MAKLSAHGDELFRYFSVSRRRLLSLRSDGQCMAMSGLDRTWRNYAKKKPEVSVDAWVAGHRRREAEQPVWARDIRSIPSQRQLEEWVHDCCCETPGGDSVEPDGYGQGGAPSWLLLLGLL